MKTEHVSAYLLMRCTFKKHYFVIPVDSAATVK